MTGEASPTNSVRVSSPKLVSQRLPLASMAMAKASSMSESGAHPVVGERGWPGLEEAEPASSVSEGLRKFVTQMLPEPSTAMP